MDATTSLPLEAIESWIKDSAALPNTSIKHFTVAEPRNRCEMTMDAIKSFIIQKKLKPGDPLPTELKLCEELQTSRSSIREAVRKLEALRIVRVVHGKGMYVGDLSLEPLVETLAFRATASLGHDFSELQGVIEVRQALDLGIAQQVTTNLKGSTQTELEQLTDEMEKLAADGKTFLPQDIAYHSRIIEFTHNPVLSQLAHSLWLVHMAVLPKLGLQVTSGLAETAEAHRNMLNAALNGDVEAYRSAVNDHYRPIEGILKPHLE
jgi:DNA-binding FadR family transcriptional regulator